MFLILQIVNSIPFCLFFLSSLCSLSQSSLFSLNSLSSQDKDFNLLHSVHQWHIILHTVSHHDISFFFNNAFYKLEKTKFLCLSSNLSYPEDLKKQWLPFSILSLLPFLISPSLSSIPSCSSDQFSVLLR